VCKYLTEYTNNDSSSAMNRVLILKAMYKKGNYFILCDDYLRIFSNLHSKSDVHHKETNKNFQYDSSLFCGLIV